jgi:putative oxidoreductase
MFGVLGGIRPNGGTVPFGLWPLWWVCLFSLVGGTLIAVGLYTRVTAALCAVMMAYLYVTMHMQHALLPTRTGGEPAALYTLIFILVASIGPGSYAIDTVIRQRRRASEIRRYLDTGNVVGISISD